MPWGEREKPSTGPGGLYVVGESKEKRMHRR
jgi:hypothetical protein